MSVKEKDYPKYLSMAYFDKTGIKLNLKHPKTLSEKIQWLKINDTTPLKTQLTDKVLVRDWIKEKIGEKYLKPALQICNNFDEINWDSLPSSFIIKCNHGCKWHFIVKNKEKYLLNKKLYEYTKFRLEYWLKHNFFGYSDFEAQYKNIKPQLIIEPLMRDNIDDTSEEFWVWCCNSTPYTQTKYEEFSEEALALSKILCKDFKFVRIDWMIYNKKIYFGEMTFTPFSGFIPETMQNSEFYMNLSKNLYLK